MAEEAKTKRTNAYVEKLEAENKILRNILRKADAVNWVLAGREGILPAYDWKDKALRVLEKEEEYMVDIPTGHVKGDLPDEDNCFCQKCGFNFNNMNCKDPDCEFCDECYEGDL